MKLKLKQTLAKITAALKGVRPIYGVTRIDNSYKATTTSWQYTGTSFKVPANHVYLVCLRCGWNTGRPVGIGLNTSTTLTEEPEYAYENANTAWASPVFMLTPATYYLFAKRGSIPTTANSHWIYYLDINMGGVARSILKALQSLAYRKAVVV